MQRDGRACWCLLALLAALFLPFAAQAACASDADCKAGRVCVSGECSDRGAARPERAPAAPDPGAIQFDYIDAVDVERVESSLLERFHGREFGLSFDFVCEKDRGDIAIELIEPGIRLQLRCRGHVVAATGVGWDGGESAADRVELTSGDRRPNRVRWTLCGDELRLQINDRLQQPLHGIAGLPASEPGLGRWNLGLDRRARVLDWVLTPGCPSGAPP